MAGACAPSCACRKCLWFEPHEWSRQITSDCACRLWRPGRQDYWQGRRSISSPALAKSTTAGEELPGREQPVLMGSVAHPGGNSECRGTKRLLGGACRVGVARWSCQRGSRRAAQCDLDRSSLSSSAVLKWVRLCNPTGEALGSGLMCSDTAQCCRASLRSSSWYSRPCRVGVQASRRRLPRP